MKTRASKNRWQWVGMTALLLAMAWQPAWAQEESRSPGAYQLFLPVIQQQNSSAEGSSAEREEAAVEVSAPLLDGEISFAANTVIATIAFDNQSVLRFVKFVSGDIALLEEAPEGALSIRSIPELSAEASLADVFYAFAEPETVMPPEVLAVAPLTATAKTQGWARSWMAAPVTAAQLTTGNCNDTNFRNAVNQFGYNDRETPDFRLNQTPRTSSYFAPDHYTPGNGLAYNFYEYVVGGSLGSIWYDVDRYASRVAVCDIDVVESSNPNGLAHPSIAYQGYSNPHMGPVVRMMYRRPGESVWSTATVRDFAANQVGTSLSWHFYTGADWDWRTDIYWAGADDSFDIGHAVEDL